MGLPNTVTCYAWRTLVAKNLLGDTGSGTAGQPHHFKFGEGGFEIVNGSREPVDPDPGLTNVTAGTGPYTSPDDYIFQKNFAGGDVIYLDPRRWAITCKMETTEANDDGHSNSPEFFELGVFDSAGHMIAYSTFPGETKTSSASITHVIYIEL